MSVELAKKRILDRIDLSALIGEDVALSNKGGRAMGLCPFHDEKSPSFVVYETNYHCFGCHEHGDAIDFVRKKRGLGFIEALKFLAEKFSVDAPELERTDHDTQASQKIALHFRLLQAAQETLIETLGSDLGAEARAYLTHRGFTAEDIKRFGFGYSDQAPQYLISGLRKRIKFGDQDAVDCSLAFRSGSGPRVYDFFRHRITIPIRDRHGRIVAFGGRTLGDDKPKYKNSRDTPLFDKSATIFGLFEAMAMIKKKKRAILVEGYMDTLTLWSHGFEETVACMGTSLTLQHLKSLTQATDQLYLIFDGDAAGKNASLRTIALALQVPHLTVKVGVLPQGEDPDSFVRKRGPQALEDLIASSENLLEFAFREKLRQCGQLEVPHLINQEFIPWLVTIPDAIQRTYLVGKLSELSSVPRRDIELALSPAKKIAPKPLRPQSSEQRSTTVDEPMVVTPLSLLEGEFLSHLYYAQPGDVVPDELHRWVEVELNWHPAWHRLAQAFLNSLKAGVSPEGQDLVAWEGASNISVLAALNKIRDRKGLFELKLNESRRDAIAKIQNTHAALKLKKARLDIKERLSQLLEHSDALTETTQCLQSINKINLRLKELGH